MTALTKAETVALLGPGTEGWHDQGLTVQAGTPLDPAAVDQVTVLRDGELVGFTRWTTRADLAGQREFKAVIGEDPRHSVAFPVGFMPPDPVRAQQGEQKRWLPGGGSR